MLRRYVCATIAAAGCFAAVPALAWDVQTKANFYNSTGETVTADMHGEMPNTSIYNGGNWNHTSYYTGSPGRGYHLKMTGRTSGKSCLVTVLVRNGGGPAGYKYMDCRLASSTPDGFDCNVDISTDGSEKLCELTFTASQ